MEKFAANLLNGEGGLKRGFEYACFTSIQQLTDKVDEHIHFQKSSIADNGNGTLNLTLDFEDFQLVYILHISQGKCEAMMRIDAIEFGMFVSKS